MVTTAGENQQGHDPLPALEPLPVKLIGRIAKLRAKEVAERGKVKVPTPKERLKGPSWYLARPLGEFGNDL